MAEPDVMLNERPSPTDRHGELGTWCMTRARNWREKRDSAFQKLHEEYYRLWRGRWVPEDKTRSSQRSRITTPALAQALEMTVAALEEATFGREQWVDFLDDKGDPDTGDIQGIRQRFLDDMNRDKVPSAISQCFLQGGLWGTLAAKVVVEESTDRRIKRGPDGTMSVEEDPAVAVPLVPIPVNELLVDIEAEHADDGLATCHEVRRSLAWLKRQPWGKEYAGNMQQQRSSDDTVGRTVNTGDPEEHVQLVNPHSVLITEWHGLVPARLLAKPRDENDILTRVLLESDDDEDTDPEDGEDFVEAIVTIADEKTVLRAIPNPFVMKDRSIVVAAFEKVPGRLHGRGVMEKGYNAQKALDAEVRTRIDVMALVSNPMMGVDNTAMPGRFDNRVRPGKVWPTNGPPKEALFPLQFPGLDPTSFNQSAEMERMVQMGTGAMDTATPLRENRRNETATGTSLIAGSFVKRSKRALHNITREFIEPVVQKILWRRMQYDPERYPADYKFRVVSTLGIVARELEQQQMLNAAQIAPPESPLQLTALKAYFDNTSSPHKAELLAAVDQMMQPDPEAQKQAQAARALELAKMRGEVLELAGKTKKAEADAVLAIAKAQTELRKQGTDTAKLQIEIGRLEKEYGELREFSRQNDIAMLQAMQGPNQSEGE